MAQVSRPCCAPAASFPIAHLLASLLLLPLAGCDGGKGTPAASFADVVAAGGEFQEPATHEDVVQSDPALEMIGNEPWQCTTTTIDLAKAPEEFPLFDPNVEVIWPGSLLQGASLGDATPRPIPLRRGPGRVTVSLLTGVPGGVSRDVPELSLPDVYDAANEVIAAAPNKLAARFTFTMDRVVGQEQLRVAANASVSGWGAKVSAALDLQKESAYNHYLVKLTQSFYTIAVEPPSSPGAMFAPSVTAADLARYVGPGNPAAYVSSVTYGRIFYLLIESTSSAARMESSINASFSGWGVKAGGSASVGWVGELENVRMKAFALGGDAGAAISAITADFETMQQFLADGGTVGTAAPISYVVRSVRHPDQVVRMGLTTKYDVTDCIPLMESFGEPIAWYDASAIRVGGSVPVADTPLDGWKDKSSAVNDAFWDQGVTLGPAKPTFQPTLVNSLMPAVTFFTSALGQSSFRFYGGGFARDAYSIVLVAAFSRQAGQYGYSVLRTSDELGQTPGLDIGFVPGTATGGDFIMADLRFGNGAAGASAHRNADDVFRVYTFVYDATAGMRYWVNGTLAAEDPTAVAPVTWFFNARIGTLSSMGLPAPGSISVAEMMAYRGALTDVQRQYVETSLMWKYRM